MGFFREGNWLSKILTVVMTAVSLAFFALGSMGYTYNQFDYLTNSFRRFLKRNSYLVFLKDLGYKAINEYVEYIKEETAVDYFTALSDGFIFLQSFIDGGYDSSFVNEYIQPFTNSPVVAGSEALMDEMGFSPVAGRRPVEADELMISLDVFEAFRQGGYLNRSGTNSQTIQIDQYSDMIGKTFTETIRGQSEEFTVVGVFDNTKAKLRDKNWEQTAPTQSVGNAKIVFSEAFEKKWVEEENAVGVSFLYAPVKDELLTRKKVESYIRASEELLRRCEDELRELFSQTHSLEDMDEFDLFQRRDYIGAYGYTFSLGLYTRTRAGGMWIVDYYALILGAVGGVLLVMAVIFNTYLITDSIYRKRREIGILRSLGYKKGKIVKMFLISALALAAVTFVVALLCTIALYYGWFRGFVTSGDGILFEFSIWTVLILLGSSFLVPLLASIVPLILFFRKPIVENIKAKE